MKKNLTLFLTLIGTICYSQNITLDDVLKLRKNDIGYVEEYLTGKGWTFLEAKEPTDEDMGTATFAYKKSEFDDTAQSFLYFMYSGFSERRRLALQINRVETYNAYLSRVKSLGCNLVESKISDGDIVKIYRGQTTTIQITTSTVKNDFDSKKTVYNFFICENEDYIRNFQE
jgi:hypothetical protein